MSFSNDDNNKKCTKVHQIDKSNGIHPMTNRAPDMNNLPVDLFDLPSDMWNKLPLDDWPDLTDMWSKVDESIREQMICPVCGVCGCICTNSEMWCGMDRSGLAQDTCPKCGAHDTVCANYIKTETTDRKL